MNWYKKAQNLFIGYKIVGVDKKTNRIYSIYDKTIIDAQIGRTYTYNNSGLFLGTSKQFCMDYYSCGTPDEDGELLLTYQYEGRDIIRGEPTHSNGEVQVKQAKLTNIDIINKEEWC